MPDIDLLDRTWYGVTVTQWLAAADIRHAKDLELLRRLQRDKVEFGFITRTVNLRSLEQ